MKRLVRCPVTGRLVPRVCDRCERGIDGAVQFIDAAKFCGRCARLIAAYWATVVPVERAEARRRGEAYEADIGRPVTIGPAGAIRVAWRR